MPNGVNFEIVNDQSKEKKVVHHYRLSPIRGGEIEENESRDVYDNNFQRINQEIRPKITYATDVTDSDSVESDSSDSDSSYDYNPDSSLEELERENDMQQRRYPLQNRRNWQLPNCFPW